MSKYVEMTHDQVIDACKSYMNDEQVAFVEKAYEYAENAHSDKSVLLVSHTLFTQLKWLVLWLL